MTSIHHSPLTRTETLKACRLWAQAVSSVSELRIDQEDVAPEQIKLLTQFAEGFLTTLQRQKFVLRLRDETVRELIRTTAAMLKSVTDLEQAKSVPNFAPIFQRQHCAYAHLSAWRQRIEARFGGLRDAHDPV